MSRRKCAKTPPGADDADGPLPKERIPKTPEEYRWVHYKPGESGVKQGSDWWNLYRADDWVLWMTGPDREGDTKVRAGHPETYGYWYRNPEEAVNELLALWRLGVVKK